MSSDMKARLTAGPPRSPWQLDAKHVISAGRQPSKAANELLRNFGKLSKDFAGEPPCSMMMMMGSAKRPPPSRCSSTVPVLPQIKPPHATRICTLPGVKTLTATHPVPRLNPLRPPQHEGRRNVSLETVETHHHNLQRSLTMQQAQHFRFHNSWRKPYYGTPAEKESHRKDIRLILQEQMAERMQMQRESFRDRKQESEFAVQHDRQCLTDDAQNYRKRAEYLQHFRDENKKLMEWKWDQSRQQRQRQDQLDREIMKYNPINWSGSLK
ncbi:uncharacterized protein [Branchiostoma lanceolatum]|uniref:uncharacterized protein isoform X2 n=1 Tax=Branchiostoma lanceolatum TaxID=7740 RepID=UPI0034524F1A